MTRRHDKIKKYKLTGETKEIGCIGCLMAGAAGQNAELKRYPKFRALYVREFDHMIDQRKSEGLPTTWRNGDEVMRWWTKEETDNV